MQATEYTIKVHVPADAADVEARVRATLAAEGFGILSTIDVQSTLQEKLGEDIGAYTILGACNPPLAHQAITADPDIGALLPCNVLVRAAADGGTDVCAADPEAMLSLSSSTALTDIAATVKRRLQRALDGVVAEFSD